MICFLGVLIGKQLGHLIFHLMKIAQNIGITRKNLLNTNISLKFIIL